MEKYLCPSCEYDLIESDDYCPNCGAVFVENILCCNHPENNAEGYCVICEKPFCEICGYKINETFLCELHQEYEIIEGHVRIRGSQNITIIEYYKSFLEARGLTPLIYYKRENSIPLGGIDHFNNSIIEKLDGELGNEYKLMISFQQALEAETILSQLEESNLNSSHPINC